MAAHVLFFIARILALDLLLPTFLFISFHVLSENLQYDAWMASALYIAVASAVVSLFYLLLFAVLLRSVFSVVSIVSADGRAGDSRLPRGGCRLLPLASVLALRFWIAERIYSPVLWFISFFQGTELYNVFLRCMGANIGRGCIILSTIDIPSLLDIGDNCFIDNGARLRCTQVVMVKSGPTNKAMLRVGCIIIGAGSYVGCQASITQGVVLPAHSHVECDAYVSESNIRAVPVAPAPPKQFQLGRYQRCVQALVIVLFWFLLLALSFVLIVPWITFVPPSDTAVASDAQSSGSPFPFLGDRTPSGVAVWYYVMLFELVIHPFAIFVLVLFHRCVGSPPRSTLPSPPSSSPGASSVVNIPEHQGVRVGSWVFFVHVILRRWFIRMFGFPFYTLQSSYIPAAIMRACGAHVGKRTLVFHCDYGLELQAPLQQVTIGRDCIITTFVQLGNSVVRDGLWYSHDVVVGNGCLLGNNSILDTAGLPLPDNSWVSALSHVTSASISAATARPHHALGCILCGNPSAAPFPVAPSALLSSSAASLMHPITSGLLSCCWAFVLAPALCPGPIEVLIVFFLLINTQWSFSSMLLLIICCEAAALLWSSTCLVAFERLSSRIVVNGAQYPMFTARWWAFHWCDMFRARYISLWPQFFADSPVFAWFMPVSLLMKDDLVEQGQCFGGVPARVVDKDV
jgi:acetyltransferase-like isoleucine patch superfamily enzyme